MSGLKAVAIQQIDAVLAQYEEEKRKCRGTLHAEQTHRVMTRMRGLVARLASPSSSYAREAKSATNEFQLLGVVKAMRDDYDADYLMSFRELLHADLFSDFLEMADYLLGDEKLKQPAAVMAGGVLEEHLRKLCVKNGVDTEYESKGELKPKRANTLNDDLARESAYGKNEQKLVAAWLGIRNSAAHAKYDEFDDAQVRGLIDGVRAFVAKYPA